MACFSDESNTNIVEREIYWEKKEKSRVESQEQKPKSRKKKNPKKGLKLEEKLKIYLWGRVLKGDIFSNEIFSFNNHSATTERSSPN